METKTATYDATEKVLSVLGQRRLSGEAVILEIDLPVGDNRLIGDLSIKPEFNARTVYASDYIIEDSCTLEGLEVEFEGAIYCEGEKAGDANIDIDALKNYLAQCYKT